MKALLKSVRAAILADADFNYLDGRVYISLEASDLVLFPPGFSCPSIVITPGAYDISWLPGDTTDETKFVGISAYRYFRESEDALMGVDSEKGVLEISDQARALLVHKDLGLGYGEAEVQRIEKPELFSILLQNDDVIRQSMTIIYKKFQ